MAPSYCTWRLLALYLLTVEAASFGFSLAPQRPPSTTQRVPQLLAICESPDGSQAHARLKPFEIQIPNISEELLRKAKMAAFSGQITMKSLTHAIAAASALQPSASDGVEKAEETPAGDAKAESDVRGQVRVRARPIVAQAATLAPDHPAAAAATAAAGLLPDWEACLQAATEHECMLRLEPPQRLDEASAVRRRPAVLDDKPRPAQLEGKVTPAALDEKAWPAARESGETRAAPSMAPKDMQLPKILIFGVGGGGGNTVARIPSALSSMLSGMGEAADSATSATLEMCLLNTDVQALTISAAAATRASADAAAASNARNPRSEGAADAVIISSVQLGASSLRGLGAGGVPERARRAAEEEAVAIRSRLLGADLVFLTAGMGGGTGSGAAPVVARLASESGALVVAVVSTPFGFEGGTRHDTAQAAIEELGKHVDVLVVVHNEKLIQILPDGLPLRDALHAADEVAAQAIVSVAAMLAASQTINVDFADLEAIMRGAGRGLITIGRAAGAGAAQAAVQAALSSPLLDVKLEQCSGLIYSITGGASLTLHQVR